MHGFEMDEKSLFLSALAKSGVVSADLQDAASGGSSTASGGQLEGGHPEAGEPRAAGIEGLSAHSIITPKNAHILVVDDEEAIRYFVQKKIAEAGYDCDRAEDGLQAMQMIGRNHYQLVVCDIRLPDIDGLEILQRIKQLSEDIAVIMLTAVTDINVAIPALKAGAYDYLVKPFDVDELMLSVEGALEKRGLKIENRLYQRTLETKVLERTRELVQKNRDLSNLLVNTIESLIFTLEEKDTYTEAHSWKVALLAANLGRKLSFDNTAIESMSLAGLLHDIGKIGVRDAILNKSSKLTAAEYSHIQQHPVVGERILAPLEPLRQILPCVRNHHEWYDGSGYPDGLVGEKIPREARILTIADAYDAITSERAYRPARSRDEALSIIGGEAGRQFDPEHVKAFLDMMRG